jgi:hypothetical protein
MVRCGRDSAPGGYASWSDTESGARWIQAPDKAPFPRQREAPETMLDCIPLRESGNEDNGSDRSLRAPSP